MSAECRAAGEVQVSWRTRSSLPEVALAAAQWDVAAADAAALRDRTPVVCSRPHSFARAQRTTEERSVHAYQS